MNPEVPAMQAPAVLAGQDLAASRTEDNLVRVPDAGPDQLAATDQALSRLAASVAELQPPQAEAEAEAEVAPAPKPWYRQRRWILSTIAGAMTVIAALVTALVLTVFASSGPASPESVLKADGYPVTMTLSPDQLGQIVGDSAGAAQIKPFVTRVVVGFKKGNVEEVFGLTSAGESLISAHASQIPSLGGSLGGSGATARMEQGDLVITGPVSVFTGTGSQGT